MVSIFIPHVPESRLNATLIIATETEQKQNQIDRKGPFLGANQAFFTVISRSAGQKPGLWLAYATAHATMGHILCVQTVKEAAHCAQPFHPIADRDPPSPLSFSFSFSCCRPAAMSLLQKLCTTMR